MSAVSACADNDRDGYQGSSPSGCTRNTAMDCNDANAAIWPRAAEVCGNGIDEDCSGADLACPTCSDGGDAPAVGGSVMGTWYGGRVDYKIVDTCTSTTGVNESICVPPPAGGGMLPSSKSDACAAGQTCIDADGSGSTPAYCG